MLCISCRRICTRVPSIRCIVTRPLVPSARLTRASSTPATLPWLSKRGSNKRGDRVGLLYWDEDAYVIVYKRLEEGTFRWPTVVADQGERDPAPLLKRVRPLPNRP